MKIQLSGSAGDEGIKCLVYGESGVGKTCLATTVERPLILSAESGLLSIKSFNIPYVDIKDFKTLVDANNWFNGGGGKEYQTIIIDSLSEMAEITLVDTKMRNKDGRMAYMEMKDRMVQIIRSFRELKKDVVMISKCGQIKDEMTGVLKYGPDMPGQKLGNDLPYFWDLVLFMGVSKKKDNPERFLMTGPDGQHQAKDRSGVLEHIEAPDLGVIFNKIRGV